MDFYFSSMLEKRLLKMFEPSFGRISIRIDTFFMLDNKLSLLMKLIIKSDNIITEIIKILVHDITKLDDTLLKVFYYIVFIDKLFIKFWFICILFKSFITLSVGFAYFSFTALFIWSVYMICQVIIKNTQISMIT